MADALCGPSTALQSFQKHASVDRTLQQDRLRALPPPSQGFRSQDPRAGAQDAEFAAFEAGHPFHPQAAPPLFPEVAAPRFTPSPFQTQPGPSSSWANDFQKLRLGGPAQPIPQSQFRVEAPLQRSQVGGASGWHAEFMKQQQSRQSPSISSASQQIYSPTQYGFQNPMQMGYNEFGASQFMPQQPMSEAQQGISQPEMSIDDAAFEDAFARAEMEHESSLTENMTETANGKQQEQEPLQGMVDDSETIRIGSDLIAEREAPQTEQEQKAEADDLARTAGELLNALKHDQDEKFQQSQFLSLMRRIRDREVEVQGDDFKETQAQYSPPGELRDQADSYQPLHPGGRYYPEQSPPPSGDEFRGLNQEFGPADMDKFDQVSESSNLTHRMTRRDGDTGVHMGMS